MAIPCSRCFFNSPAKAMYVSISGQCGYAKKLVAHFIQVSARVSESHRDQVAAGVAAKNAGDAKIDIADNITAQDHQVPGMQVCMKHSVPEGIAQKIIDEPAGEEVLIE